MKRFLFPSFEDWKASGYEWSGHIGDYHCRASKVVRGCGDNTEDTYMVAVSVSENPCNMCVRKVVCYSETFDRSEESSLKSWYEDVCVEVNEEWQNYIRQQYLEETDDDLRGQQVFLPRTVFEFGEVQKGKVLDVWSVHNSLTGTEEIQYLVEVGGKKSGAVRSELAFDRDSAIEMAENMRRDRIYGLQSQLTKLKELKID